MRWRRGAKSHAAEPEVEHGHFVDDFFFFGVVA